MNLGAVKKSAHRKIAVSIGRGLSVIIVPGPGTLTISEDNCFARTDGSKSIGKKTALRNFGVKHGTQVDLQWLPCHIAHNGGVIFTWFHFYIFGKQSSALT